jgi:Kef-type K+ transport system membrane component KefB
MCVVLFVAKLGADIAVRLGQPEVLGELVAGIVLGNLGLFGIHRFDYLASDETFEVLSELGVILLLFEVGLATNLAEMLRVGGTSFLVAIVGVVCPMLLGWFVHWHFFPELSRLSHLFVGATLCATSVGITARVLRDLGAVTTAESRIILGAAVIDDVLGLVVLAILSGLATDVAAAGQSGLQSLYIAKVVGLSLGFFVAAALIGRFVSPLCFRLATLLHGHGLLLTTSLLLCFLFAYGAAKAGLAPIVGAFVAGLVLEPVHYVDLARKHEEEIDPLLAPLTSVFVPIFFVLMGTRVDLGVFSHPETLWFALWLTAAAIVGKQACGAGVYRSGVDRTTIGLGMIPRGEVGLIFAGIGQRLAPFGRPIIDEVTFGAVVVMVVLTTVATPPLLKWRFGSMGCRVV